MADDLRVSDETIQQLQTAQGHADRAFEAAQAFKGAINGLRASGHSGDWLDGLEEYATNLHTAHQTNHESAMGQLSTHIQGLTQILEAQRQLGQNARQNSQLR
jgi:hypothetical protein